MRENSSRCALRSRTGLNVCRMAGFDLQKAPSVCSIPDDPSSSSKLSGDNGPRWQNYRQTRKSQPRLHRNWCPNSREPSPDAIIAESHGLTESGPALEGLCCALYIMMARTQITLEAEMRLESYVFR